MKIVYFVNNGKTTVEQNAEILALRADGHKVVVSNGSVKFGFEDSCDRVHLACDSELIETWAKKKGIEITKSSVKPVAPEPEDKPTTRRGRKPKQTTTDDSGSAE